MYIKGNHLLVSDVQETPLVDLKFAILEFSDTPSRLLCNFEKEGPLFIDISTQHGARWVSVRVVWSENCHRSFMIPWTFCMLTVGN